IAAPDLEAIKKVHPKNHLAGTLKELEVSAPETWLPENEDDLRKMAKNELTFPVLIKPYDQSSGRGIHKVEDQDELLKYYQENHEKFGQQSLIQNIVKGKEYCYCALYDHGEKKAGMAYQNLFTFPPASGPGAMRETIDSKVFAEVADPLMRKLNWNGVAEFDFFWNGDDESLPKLIEVNGRLWGGLFQSVESGIDFPWLLFLLTADGSVNTSQTAEIGTKTKLPGTWMISALHDIIVNDENANEIEQKGQAALQSLKDGEILDGLKEFGSYLQAHINEKKNRIEAVTELGRAARSQVLDTDDPLAGWGFLFILSSLLRHGELPKEVRF
ncbi:MAG: ATP-grasp domain-containing protein, partial [Alphaproteobacteria bacterium]